MSGTARVRTVSGLRAELHDVLSRYVPRGSTVALVDFPSYPNVGDSAIWLGTAATLHRLGCRIAYVSDEDTYSREALERRLPPGCPVLVQGGGNLGDWWPDNELFRERVVGDFPDRPVVLMPVSIHFRDPVAEERAEAALNGHDDLTLLCRDEASLTYAREHFPRAEVALCPDGALGLDPPSRRPPYYEVTMLLRSDKEMLERIPLLPGARVVDWTSQWGEPGYSRIWQREWRLSHFLGTAITDGGGADRLRQPVVDRLFAAMARQRLRFGYDVVSCGRVLVTDRLHGHILALLLGVTHVVHDTGYGKVRGFYEAFSRGMDGVTLCEDLDDLGDVVGELAAQPATEVPTPRDRATETWERTLEMSSPSSTRTTRR